MEAMVKLGRYNYTLYGNEATFFLLALKSVTSTFLRRELGPSTTGRGTDC